MPCEEFTIDNFTAFNKLYPIDHILSIRFLTSLKEWFMVISNGESPISWTFIEVESSVGLKMPLVF